MAFVNAALLERVTEQSANGQAVNRGWRQHSLLRGVALDYATTQNNRAALLRALASLPGEDREARLRQALRSAAEAVVLFEQFQHVQYLEIGRRVLSDLRRACGTDFASLWAEAGLGEPLD